MWIHVCMRLTVICVHSNSDFFVFLFLQKRRDRAAESLSNGVTANRAEASSTTEDISVPKDLDLIALPQLCFPGMMSLSVKLH